MDALEKLGVNYDVLQGIMDAEKNFPPDAGACQNTMRSRNPSCHTHNMT